MTKDDLSPHPLTTSLPKGQSLVRPLARASFLVTTSQNWESEATNDVRRASPPTQGTQRMDLASPDSAGNYVRSTSAPLFRLKMKRSPTYVAADIYNSISGSSVIEDDYDACYDQRMSTQYPQYEEHEEWLAVRHCPNERFQLQLRPRRQVLQEETVSRRTAPPSSSCTVLFPRLGQVDNNDCSCLTPECHQGMYHQTPPRVQWASSSLADMTTHDGQTISIILDDDALFPDDIMLPVF
jgi:hypothetical protein